MISNNKLVVIVQDFPSPSKIYAMSYVLPRVKYYKQVGIDVVVVNISAKNNYIYDGISVITIFDAKKIIKLNDILVLHAPNLRGHLRFLFAKNKKIIHFHGHEILWTFKTYPPPYKWEIIEFLKYIIRLIYDPFKISFWKIYFKYSSTKFIFISDNLLDRVIDIYGTEILGRSAVIPNPVAKIFIDQNYKISHKKLDIIVIRKANSTYKFHEVIELAKKNPKINIDMYCGSSIQKLIPKNLRIKENFIRQSDIPALLDSYKCALMLSATDTQGVMACEIAVYGMPLIVSDTPGAKEFLADFSNVVISKDSDLNLCNLPQPRLIKSNASRFDPVYVCSKELAFYEF